MKMVVIFPMGQIDMYDHRTDIAKLFLNIGNRLL